MTPAAFRGVLLRIVLPPTGPHRFSGLGVLKQQNITKLPIDPFRIAEAKDIILQENPSLDAGVSGCLMRVGDHFGIMYSTRFPSNGFRRFTVAHELGHYFLEGHPEHRFKDGCTLHTSSSGFISDDRYEQEADAYAASLLMPPHLFREAAATAGNGLDAVIAIATLSEMSLTSTAIRYARLVAEPVAVVLSMNRKVLFSIMSPMLRAQRNLTWLKKGNGIPSSTHLSVRGRQQQHPVRADRIWLRNAG